MAEPAIRISGLRVARGGRVVLPGVDLEIERGVVTGLLGPSGCGKSTLMRSIVGVQKVAGGDVQRSWPGGRIGRAAPTGRLRDAGAIDLQRRDGTREPSLLRQHLGRWGCGRLAGDRVGRPGGLRVVARGAVVRGPARAALARDGASQPPGAAGAGRADRGPRSGDPGAAVGDVQAPRGERRDAARLEPCDGRSEPLSTGSS